MASSSLRLVPSARAAAERLPPEARERNGAALERRSLVLVAPVEELRGAVQRGAEGLVVRVPAWVAPPAGVRHDPLHLHVVEQRAPGAAVAVDPHRLGVDPARDSLALRTIAG